LLIKERRFDAIMYSKLGNENSDAGHNKCSRGTHLARGPMVLRTWLRCRTQFCAVINRTERSWLLSANDSLCVRPSN